MRTSGLWVVLALTACGGPAMTTGAGGVRRAEWEGRAGQEEEAVRAGGMTAAALTVAECETDMARFEAASCPDQSGWTMMKTTICPKIPNPTAAICATPLTKAKACHAQFQSAQLSCVLGNTDSTDPCAIDVLLGVLCVATMNSAQCAGASCMYSSDCPTGYVCNDKTDRCVNTSASCFGLPCKYSSDCPTGQTCNNATEQCNRN